MGKAQSISVTRPRLELPRLKNVRVRIVLVDHAQKMLTATSVATDYGSVPGVQLPVGVTGLKAGIGA